MKLSVKHIVVFALWILILQGMERVSAQINTTTRKQYLTIGFLYQDIRIESGDIISNVVKVVNISERNMKFVVKLDFPSNWKYLFHSDITYELDAGDSLFIPVRLIPNKQLSGNSKYMISAFANSVDDVQLATGYFWAFTERKKSWVLNIEPTTKNYFKNGSNSSNFRVNILNTGTETQPIHLYFDYLGLYSVLTDSNDKIIQDPSYNLSLKPFQDTTISFHFKYINGIRNSHRVDIENHRPQNANEEKQFSLMVNTTEPTLSGTSDFDSRKRVQFMLLT